MGAEILRGARAAASLAGLGLAAGMGDPAECGHEQRRLEAAGSGGIQMTIIQERPEQTVWVFWKVSGAELAGHVMRLRIVRAANPDSVLLELPVHPPASADSLLAFPLNPPSATGEFYESVLAGETLAEVLTDLAQPARVLAPLSALSSTDWRDPVCD
jgi:hypothetical protein